MTLPPWVCLMYHDVLEHAPGASGGAEHFAVSAQGFARQLDAIASAGLHGVTLETMVAGDGGDGTAITFDDGNMGQFLRAVPALVERGMAATFFIVTDWVGRQDYVGWGELREMVGAGMSVQAHTRTHPFLSELSPRATRDELAGCRTELEDRLGQTVTTLAFPGGDAPRGRWRDLLVELGYRTAATSRWGVNRGAARSGPMAVVRRCTIRGEPSADSFGRIVRGDPVLGMRRAVREGILRVARRSLGPSRYARWRRHLLGRGTAAPATSPRPEPRDSRG